MLDYAGRNVVSAIVEHDLCIGCGVCAPVCSRNSIAIQWNKYGLYEPVIVNTSCNDCSACLRVCPFSCGIVENIQVPNEDELGMRLFVGPQIEKDQYLGYYRKLFVGYAEDYRMTSSSGGISTWALTHLLENDYIDAAICVQPNHNQEDSHFSYNVCETTEAIRAAAKTRYYPVSINQAIELLLEKPGHYALIALPCTVKALRLAVEQMPILSERIIFMIGIFCGGLKTRNYTEYLAATLDVESKNIRFPEYRVKKPTSTADDYVFTCEDNVGKQYAKAMRTLGDMWGTGLFKPNACDFCDDLSAELADLSVGDAWIPPYRADGRGNNVLVVRSEIALKIIQEGIVLGHLKLDEITPTQANTSQQGNINHRRHGLAYRLKWAQQKGLIVPRKRVYPKRSFNPILIIQQQLRMRVRSKSHVAWLAQREMKGTLVFNQMMSADLIWLKRVTRLSHLVRNCTRNMKSIWTKFLAFVHRYIKKKEFA